MSVLELEIVFKYYNLQNVVYAACRVSLEAIAIISRVFSHRGGIPLWGGG